MSGNKSFIIKKFWDLSFLDRNSIRLNALNRLRKRVGAPGISSSDIDDEIVNIYESNQSSFFSEEKPIDNLDNKAYDVSNERLPEQNS